MNIRVDLGRKLGLFYFFNHIYLPFNVKMKTPQVNGRLMDYWILGEGFSEAEVTCEAVVGDELAQLVGVSAGGVVGVLRLAGGR